MRTFLNLTAFMLIVTSVYGSDPTPKFKVSTFVTPKFKSEYTKALEAVKKREVYIGIGYISNLDTSRIKVEFKCDSMAGYEDGVYKCWTENGNPVMQKQPLAIIVPQMMPATPIPSQTVSAPVAGYTTYYNVGGTTYLSGSGGVMYSTCQNGKCR